MPTTVSLETSDPRSHQRASDGARTGDVSRSDSSVAVKSSTESRQGAAPGRDLLRIVVPVVATLSYVASLAALLVDQLSSEGDLSLRDDRCAPRAAAARRRDRSDTAWQAARGTPAQGDQKSYVSPTEKTRGLVPV
jgi:hypothetical protein